jgi:hypothetical protein
MPTPPAGWYRDRRNSQMMRWWDGEHWSDQTRPIGAPLTAPAPPPAPVAVRSPWWKAPWLLLVIAGVGAGLALGAGIGAASSSTVNAGATVTATATTTVEATVTARPVISNVVATRTQLATVTYHPTYSQYGEGTYVVGTDIKPGLYHTQGGDICYWARLSSLDTTKIIDNNTGTGPQTVEIKPTDKAFQVQGDCKFGPA